MLFVKIGAAIINLSFVERIEPNADFTEVKVFWVSGLAKVYTGIDASELLILIAKACS